MAINGISVIIPNYNGETLLPEILPSLYVALKNTELNYEIIICDDCSTDNSLIILANYYPTIRVIKNEKNVGFAPTINNGIFAAIYSHLLLLNSDVKLTPTYFKTQFKYFENADTFGVMGRIVGWDSNSIQDAAKYPAFHNLKIKTSGNYYLQHPQKNDCLFSMYLSGANAFVCREKIIELGGYNEMFAPFYVEDFELSIRAWRLGYQCFYDHFAICQHKTSTTIKTSSSKRFVNTIYYRNKMYLHAIHLPKNKLFLWNIQNIMECLVQICIGKFYYFNAFKLYILGASKIKNTRQLFNNLQNKKNKSFTIFDIKNLILDSLKLKSINRF